MKNLFHLLHTTLTQGQDAVLVTVVASSGSPRVREPGCSSPKTAVSPAPSATAT